MSINTRSGRQYEGLIDRIVAIFGFSDNFEVSLALKDCSSPLAG